jgi:hypothetical protein
MNFENKNLDIIYKNMLTNINIKKAQDVVNSLKSQLPKDHISYRPLSIDKGYNIDKGEPYHCILYFKPEKLFFSGYYLFLTEEGELVKCDGYIISELCEDGSYKNKINIPNAIEKYRGWVCRINESFSTN